MTRIEIRITGESAGRQERTDRPSGGCDLEQCMDGLLSYMRNPLTSLSEAERAVQRAKEKLEREVYKKEVSSGKPYSFRALFPSSDS